MAKKKHVLVWVKDDCDEDAPPSLCFRDEWNDGEPATDATLEQIAECCDEDAENGNYHDICGLHAALGKLLTKRLGKKVATAIIRDIAEQGGLCGMAGLY